jgi:hypothetical protein
VDRGAPTPIHSKPDSEVQHMTTYTPYTYLIGWSSLDKWYYGVRYAKNCHPDDFWTKYHTSSKIVNDFRIQNGDPDIIQIRNTFSNAKSALEWEHKVLRRLKIINNNRWLNLWLGNGSDHMFGGIIQSNLAKRRVSNGSHNIFEWHKSIDCPVCGKNGQAAAMKRWHFDNCGKEYIRPKSHSKKLSIKLKNAWKDPNKFITRR